DRVDWQQKFSAPISPAGATKPATSLPVQHLSSMVSPSIERCPPSVPETILPGSSKESEIIEAPGAIVPEQPTLPQSMSADRTESPVRPQSMATPPYLEPGPAPKRDQQFQIIGVLNRLYV